MLPRPPSPYRASFDCASFDLGTHLRRVFDIVGFVPSEPTEVGKPGSYHGQSRRGGSSYSFAIEHFGREVMTKFDDEKSETDVMKTKAALRRFDEAEELCAATNRRFHKYMLGHRPANERVARAMVRAREKIGNLLSQVNWSRVREGCTFTSGSSVTLPRGRSTAIHKYSTKVESTKHALSTVSEIFSQIPALTGGIADGHGILIVPGNKLTCVPKNYKVHRMIAGEADGNMYAQKGLHKEIRLLLRQVGVDLSDQSINQDFALLGSKTGLVATVDMSMASDTVAYTVVEWFYSLVPEVFDYLDRCRSASGEFADCTVTYEKFSSMGNATTFEIESSIFWALAAGVCDVEQADSRFVGIYGDDVVLPNRCVPLYFEVLEECGFRPNVDKTFWDKGYAHTQLFRESCGKHYFNGENVTPVYIRKQPKSLLDYFHLVNNLVRWTRRLELLSDAPCLQQLWDYIAELRSLAPEKWVKPRIPDGFGDGAFIGTFDECAPSTYKGRKSMWVEGYRVEVLTERFDQAVGRSAAGFPLKRSRKEMYINGRKTVMSVLTPVESKDEKKVVASVTALGFALASLEKLEKQEDQTMVRDVLRRLSPKIVALIYAGRDLATEGMSIELKSTRQVVPSMLTVPLSVSW
nr:MAG: RNA replicase beta chain [ssRNA phage SRR6960799_10]